MPTQPKITRIEIGINPDTDVIGAQVERGSGLVVGLNAGNHPEYSETLTEVLGEGMTQALAANAILAEQLAAMTAERDQLRADLDQARRSAVKAAAPASGTAKQVSADELTAVLSTLLNVPAADVEAAIAQASGG